MIHDTHHSILVPPLWVLDAFDFSTHNDDLSSWDQFAATVSGSKMLRNAGGSNLAVQCLCQAANHLSSLPRSKSSWRTGREDEVAVEIDNESISRSCEEGAALSRHTNDVWSWFLNQFLDVPRMDDRNVEATPFVDSNAEADGFGGNCEHSWIVAGEDDTASRRNGSFDDTDNVRDREARKERPH